MRSGIARGLTDSWVDRAISSGYRSNNNNNNNNNNNDAATKTEEAPW